MKHLINKTRAQKTIAVVTQYPATAVALFLLFGLASSQATSVYTLSVPGTVPWYDTGIDIVAGDQIQITANGTVTFGVNPGQATGPDGGDLYGGNTFDPLAFYPNTVVVSLVGKIGGTTAIGTGTPLPAGVVGNGAGFVGSSYNQIAPLTGRLFLGFNDHADAFGDNYGAFNVIVSVPEPSTAALASLGFFFFLKRRILRG